MSHDITHGPLVSSKSHDFRLVGQTFERLLRNFRIYTALSTTPRQNGLLVKMSTTAV